MKLSKHSKKRMKERANIKSEAIQKNFFKNALKYGKSLNDCEDNNLIKFIKEKTRYNCQIKVYKNWVFIYSKNAHQLYTMYELPNELKEG